MEYRWDGQDCFLPDGGAVADPGYEMERSISLSLISKSVTVRHLSVATNHDSPFRLQLRSITSLPLSPPKALRTPSSLSSENIPCGKRYDVTMTYSPISVPVPR